MWFVIRPYLWSLKRNQLNYSLVGYFIEENASEHIKWLKGRNQVKFWSNYERCKPVYFYETHNPCILWPKSDFQKNPLTVSNSQHCTTNQIIGKNQIPNFRPKLPTISPNCPIACSDLKRCSSAKICSSAKWSCWILTWSKEDYRLESQG